MNFLDTFDISDKEYQYMLITYGISPLENLKCNINNAYDVKDFLKTIGIKNIKEILIGYLDFFLLDIEEVKYIFIKNGIETTVNDVNEDFHVLEKLILD